ncbi:MAG: flavoprotein [Herpetosiphonaceae bacterium]|nr:MAG: flavoprotein [Herpetosiphonaceae bacterium]
MESKLPVAIVGAGPIGLAAAAHLISAGETPLIFEAGSSPGHNILAWGHVRLFSPWKYNIDRAAAALLEAAGWVAPNGDEHPTGQALVENYLQPLAALPQLRPHIRYNTRVVAITRQHRDKMKTAGREDAPFKIVVQTDGREEVLLARAVIDASGTFATPNPLGADGLPALGEAACADRIFYGIPDILGADRARYAGRRVLVVGAGHSALHAVIDLVRLAAEEPATRVIWAVRRGNVQRLFGGGDRDQLPLRGRLGQEAQRLVDGGAVELVTGFNLERLVRTSAGMIAASDEIELPPVDEIIAATGFRPDLSLERELRLALDPITESPVALAPLIDPNIHSCGTVPPHGVEELQHPERNFFIAGMKSYGRAPTFLLLTGYEQVRSIVAALIGDWESARSVELQLPETGVCSSRPQQAEAGGGCCGAGLSQPAQAASCGSSSQPAYATGEVVPLVELAPTTTCCGQ